MQVKTSKKKTTPFIQNSNRMASSVDRFRKFSERIFQVLYYSRQRRSFSAHMATLMTKHDLTFPAFYLRFVDFAVQFCFPCKSVSFHEKRLTVAWFSRTNHKALLRIAPNEIALFCIDNRSRQIAIFVLAKLGKGRLLSNVERFWNKDAFSLCLL